MDYGMQFFAGYPGVTISLTPVPAKSRHAERGPMYFRDIDDKRGEAELTPQALGKMIVSQPEFAACMVQRVSDYVLGDSTPEDRQTLAHAFAETGQFRTLFVAALRLAAKRALDEHAPSPTAPVLPILVPRSIGDQVTVPDHFVARLVDQCGECHSEGSHAFLAGLEKTHTLPRDLLLRAGNFVSSGLMPKDSYLSPTERSGILNDIIGAVAPNETWATRARAYWIDELRGSRTFHIGVVRERIARESGYTLTAADRVGTIEDKLEGDLMTLTPSFVSLASQFALRACRPLVNKPAEYRTCLRRAMRPDGLIVK
jgi:hypothetical protein